jgi:hypothetical protein
VAIPILIVRGTVAGAAIDWTYSSGLLFLGRCS